MTTPLYSLIEKLVEDFWVVLDREHITPWAFMTAGPLFKCTDFYGRQISYQGVEFEGSPQGVFWARFIEPFLENIIERVVTETLRLSSEKRQDPKLTLVEASTLLKSLIHRAYGRMADIDYTLRGGRKNPGKVPLRNTDSEIAGMEQFLDRRINAELAMLKPWDWVNKFYKEHPFFFWLIGFLIAAAGVFLAG
ncbi:MAG TPA: hypothetical protein DD706_04625 [Nitrospiraceae bacterium]|nr:hypothetical protein [Nitrospiraceae bacterium]